MRSRQVGETEAVRLFRARVGYAWRHFGVDAPFASKRCQRGIREVLTLAAGKQLRAPPGLEQIIEAQQEEGREDIKQMPRDEIQDVGRQAEKVAGDIVEPALGLANLGICDETKEVETEKSTKASPLGLGAFIKEKTVAVEKLVTNLQELIEGLQRYDSEGERQSSRTLRPHISDVSTCIDEGMGEVRSEAISLADTEEWSKRTRKPRKGRRKKARLRREEYEEAKRSASREAHFEGGGREGLRAFLGPLIECMADSDGGGEVEHNDATDHALGADDKEETESHSSLLSDAGDALGTSVQAATAGGHERQHAAEEPTEEESVTEAAGPWEDPFFAEVARGAKLLPRGVLEAILEYQMLVNETRSHSLATLEEDVARLGPTIEKIEDELLDWDCPQGIKGAWMELEQVLLEEEYGPRNRFRRLQDTMEEVKDDVEDDDESAREAWAIDIQIIWSGMVEGCELILDAIQRIAYAKARQEYIEEQRVPGKRLARLKTEEIQALMAERLAASRRGR